MNISWLNSNPHISSFLDRHISSARVLGGSAESEEEFKSSIRDSRNAGTFRGINSFFASPFEISKLNNFKGMKENVHNKQLKPPFAPPSEKLLHARSDSVEKKLEVTSRIREEDQVLLTKNKSLAELISNDTELRDAFINGDYADVKEKLSLAAKEKLGWNPNITQKFLEEHPDEAAIITADLGNVSNLLSEKDLADALTSDVLDRLENEVFGRLSEKAANLFSDAPKLNEEFFNENPKAALYLLKHPEEINRLDSNRIAQDEFHDHVALYENLVDPVAEAKKLADGNVALGNDFWDGNPELSLIMMAERAVDLSSEMQKSALDFPKENYEKSTLYELLSHDQAKRAKKLLGDNSTLSLSFLEEHSGFSRLLNEDPDFAETLNEDSGVSELFQDNDSKTARILRSYVSGLPGRDRSSWHWWA